MSWCSRCSKEEYLERLRVRVGHPSPNSSSSAFEFASSDPLLLPARWRNLEQLEAVVEFYANYRTAAGDGFGDPWGVAAPLGPNDAGYLRVNLGPVRGTKATVVGDANTSKKVLLDGPPDLTGIAPDPAYNGPLAGAASANGYPAPMMYLRDTIRLDAAKGRDSRLFRIMKVKDSDHTVEVDVAPKLDGKSGWEIQRRPFIVVVDPLGGRRVAAVAAPYAETVWQGSAATFVSRDAANDRTVLQLDGNQPLDRVNAGFDTIYLADDTAGPGPMRPARTYRIFAVDLGQHRVTVAGQPAVPAGGSAWNLPAGVSGTPGYLEYDLAHAAGAPGYDHYDAGLFVVHRGRVQQMYRWSTFTSRAAAGANLRSIRGNGPYYYAGWRSGDAFKNYTLMVVDANPQNAGLRPSVGPDTVAHARYYFAQPAADAGGDQHIRFHRGNRNGVSHGTGSEGCVTSPDFVLMRNLLVKLYQEDYCEFYGVGSKDFDPAVAKLRLGGATADEGHGDVDTVKKLNDQSQVRWHANGGNGDPSAADWMYKLAGTFWLVRPDEPAP